MASSVGLFMMFTAACGNASTSSEDNFYPPLEFREKENMEPKVEGDNNFYTSQPDRCSEISRGFNAKYPDER